MPILVRNALDHCWRVETLCVRGHTRAHCAGEKHFLHSPDFAGSAMLAAVVKTNTARSSLNYARISALICYSEASAIFRFLTCALIPKSRIGPTWLVIRPWTGWAALEFNKRVVPSTNNSLQQTDTCAGLRRKSGASSWLSRGPSGDFQVPVAEVRR